MSTDGWGTRVDVPLFPSRPASYFDVLDGHGISQRPAPGGGAYVHYGTFGKNIHSMKEAMDVVDAKHWDEDRDEDSPVCPCRART